jgi:SPP1 gp7 family putative phage head morphogenesis protein
MGRGDKNEEVNYWEDRAKARTLRYWNVEGRIEKSLIKNYGMAAAEILDEIAIFYSKYLGENINLQTAKKGLTVEEIKVFKTKISEYETRISQKDKDLALKLSDMKNYGRISRLDELLLNIEMKLSNLADDHDGLIEETLKAGYKNARADSIIDISEIKGIKVSYAEIPDATVRQVIKTPWSGIDFSEMVWENKRKLVTNLKRNITLGIIRGENPNKRAKVLQKDMNTAASNAVRIMRTEYSATITKASLDSYSSCGVQKYIIVAVLDDRTSEICRSLNGQVFEVQKAVIGVNVSPFHPYCRTTIVPVLFDEEKECEQIKKLMAA